MPRTKTRRLNTLIAFAAASFFTGLVWSADLNSDLSRPLAHSKRATVTLGDFRADLLRLPEELRGQVLSNQRRIAGVIHNILKAKTLADEARKLGLDKEPLNVIAVERNVDRVLTALYMDHLNAKAKKDFDDQVSAHLRRAKEIYTVQSGRYAEPEQVRAAHILIATAKRSRDEALALAQKLRAEIAAGADFSALAKQHSDDPGSKIQGGDLGFFEAKSMVQPFAQEAFRISAKEPLGAVVESKFGFHVIQFIDRKPSRQKTFDEVKNDILAELKQEYVSDVFAAKMREFQTDSSLEIDEASFDILHFKITPDMLREAAANPPKP